MQSNYWFEVRLNAATWLLQNTKLTPKQIGDYLSIADGQLTLIRDGKLDFQKWPGSPLARKWLSHEDIERAERNPDWSLPSSLSKDPRIALNALKTSDLLREREVFYEARVVRAFFISYGRNAWHSTWIRQYYRQKSMWLTFIAAKEEAEIWRKQGSVLRIRETPAVALLSNLRALLLVEINPSPHLTALAASDENMSVLDLVQSVLCLPSDTVTTLVTSCPVTFCGAENVQAGKIMQHTASPKGPSLRLGWRAHPADDYGLPAVRKLARRTNSRLGNNAALEDEAVT